MSSDSDHQLQKQSPRIVLLGIPWDANSSFRRGAAEAPDHIRAAFHSPSANMFTECGLDLKDNPRLEDRGYMTRIVLDVPGFKPGLQSLQKELVVKIAAPECAVCYPGFCQATVQV